MICKRNTPIAELRAIVPARTELRKVGGAAGRMTVPESFFQPLPEEVLIDFEGGHSCRRGLHCRREAPDRPTVRVELPGRRSRKKS